MFDFITEALLGKVKTYLTIVSIIVAIVGGTYGIFERIRAAALEAEKNSLKNELAVKTTEVVTYQNELGQTVTKTLEYTRTIDQLEHSKDSLEVKLYQTIKASNVKKRNIQQAAIIASETTGGGQLIQTGTEPIVMDTGVDTVPVLEFDDGYMSARIVADSISYTYRDSIGIITTPQKVDRDFFLWKWIGWKKKTNNQEVEIVSSNPNSKLKGRFIKPE